MLDAAGAQLGTRAGGVTRLVVSAHRQLAILDGTRVITGLVDQRTVTWTELALGRQPQDRVIDLAYRGAELDMFATSGELLGYRSWLYTARSGIKQFTWGPTPAASDVMIVASGEGKLLLNGTGLDLAIPLPAPVQNLRIAARPGVSRFAVIGNGIVLVTWQGRFTHFGDRLLELLVGAVEEETQGAATAGGGVDHLVALPLQNGMGWLWARLAEWMLGSTVPGAPGAVAGPAPETRPATADPSPAV